MCMIVHKTTMCGVDKFGVETKIYLDMLCCFVKCKAFSFRRCVTTPSVGDNTPVSQTAHLGGSVTINCRYSRAEESYVRCLCREDENFHCKSLISAYTSDCTKKDRFSLIDNKQQGVYTVTISTLTLADAGRYQCAMERFNNSSTACLTRIDLQILSEY